MIFFDVNPGELTGSGLQTSHSSIHDPKLHHRDSTMIAEGYGLWPAFVHHRPHFHLQKMRELVDNGGGDEKPHLKHGLCTMVGQHSSGLAAIHKRFDLTCFLGEDALAGDLGDQGAPRYPD